MPWQKLEARLKTREKQLVAWSAMMDSKIVKRTKLAIWLTDMVRACAVFCVVVLTVKILGWPMLAGAAAGFAAYPVLTLAKWWSNDALLARAFTTLTPARRASLAPTSTPSAPSAPSAPMSAVDDDDARDFDDDERAPAPPPKKRVRKAKPKTRERDAVDFDDAA